MKNIEVLKLTDIIYNIDVDCLFLSNYKEQENITTFLNENDFELDTIKKHILDSNYLAIKPIVLVENGKLFNGEQKYITATHRDSIICTIIWEFLENISNKTKEDLKLSFIIISEDEYNEYDFGMDIQSI